MPSPDSTSLIRSIARGPLFARFESSALAPLVFPSTLPPLKPAFIVKGKIGRHFRSVSRSGFIVLMTAFPLFERANPDPFRLRLSLWHRSHRPGEPDLPCGLLLHARPFSSSEEFSYVSLCHAEVASTSSATAVLSLDLGGIRFLNFFK